jgi:hypothetical protein
VEGTLGVLTTLLTVLSAYLGLQTVLIANARDDAQSSSASKDAQLNDLNARVTALEQANQRLGSENGQLRSQLGLPAPNADPQVPSAATVRRSGQVTIAVSGDAIDLDAPKTDLQWTGSGSDLSYDGTKIGFAYYGQFLALGKTPATYDKCASQTGFANGNDAFVEIGTVEAGDYLCVLTGDKRMAAVRILKFDATAPTFRRDRLRPSAELTGDIA